MNHEELKERVASEIRVDRTNQYLSEWTIADTILLMCSEAVRGVEFEHPEISADSSPKVAYLAGLADARRQLLNLLEG